MKTATEYRAMADECFKWARETQTDEVRASYRQLARVWLDAASKLDGRASRSLTEKAPKPRSSTRSPRRKPSTISSSIALMIFSMSRS
jgi:hypothetical protein